MKTTTISAILLASLSIEVSAFYPYIPPGYAPAAKRVPISSAIAGPMGLEKFSLHKRRVARRTPLKRDTQEKLNDFEVEKSKTPSLPNSAAIDEDSTDYSYFCEVTLGTNPGLPVYLLMDTGSSVLWVMGDDCTTQACIEHDQFGSSDSSTYKSKGSDFFIQYATGNVSGDVVTDQISLAGFSFDMDFGVAKTTTDEFVNYPIDGIMGLARTPGPGPDMPTFLQMLQQNKIIKSNIFGMNLQRASDGSNDGEINFGSIDTSKFKGDLNWQNTVGSLSVWSIPIDGIMVDGTFTDLDGDRTAILDSGTSYLYVPPADAKPIFDAIPGDTPIVNGSYVIPCNTDAQVSLVFNGVAYSLPLKDYVGQPLGDGCVSHIFPQDVVGDGKTWLVGDTFLKNVYTVYDSDQSRIGLGAKGDTTTITSLVTSPTPSVSAGSNQILSSLPSATHGSSSSSGTSSGSSGAPSSSASGAMLPIGPGGSTPQGSSSSTGSDSSSGGGVSSGTLKPSAGASTNGATTGAASSVSSFTLFQSTTAFLLLVGILML